MFSFNIRYTYMVTLLTFNLYTQIPQHITNFSKMFNIPIQILSNWSFVESSHNPKTNSVKMAIGRYQITKAWLDDYMRYTGQAFPSNWIEYLKNDEANTWIACWTWDWYRKKGFSQAEILNMWFWGRVNVYSNGKWNHIYTEKILGSYKKELNYDAYYKLEYGYIPKKVVIK